MQKAKKISADIPAISVFIPSLRDELADSHPNGTAARSWQPRWTILLSIVIAFLLWAGMGSLASMLSGN